MHLIDLCVPILISRFGSLMGGIGEETSHVGGNGAYFVHWCCTMASDNDGEQHALWNCDSLSTTACADDDELDLSSGNGLNIVWHHDRIAHFALSPQR